MHVEDLLIVVNGSHFNFKSHFNHPKNQGHPFNHPKNQGHPFNKSALIIPTTARLPGCSVNVQIRSELGE
jgi:hypothetical protein